MEVVISRIEARRRKVCVPDAVLTRLVSGLRYDLAHRMKAETLSKVVVQVLKVLFADYPDKYVSIPQFEKIVFREMYSTERVRSVLSYAREKVLKERWALKNEFGVGYKWACEHEVAEELYKSVKRSLSHAKRALQFYNFTWFVNPESHPDHALLSSDIDDHVDSIRMFVDDVSPIETSQDAKVKEIKARLDFELGRPEFI